MHTDSLDTVDALLCKLVRINSVNSAITGRPGAEKEMGDFYEHLARSRGFDARRLPVPGGCDNLLVTCRVADGLPWIMFESHMDTVTLEGMSIDPLGGKVEAGRIWGRGACDTKGTGAAMFQALGQYARVSRRPNNVAIAFTVDEEYGMTGVRALVGEHWRSLGFSPAGVIVGEPTNLRPIVAHNGAVRWNVTAAGVAAHSSDPSKGRSAIADMVRVIDAIEEHYIATLSAGDALTGKARCSINTIHGGTQLNIIPAECRIGVDRRVVPGEDHRRVLPEVQKILDDLASRRPGLRVKLDELFSCPPLGRSHNGPLAAKVQSVLGSMGLPAQEQGVPFATDAGDLDQAGIPAVVIGPGDIAQAHTRDEWIDLAQLRQGVEVYQRIMAMALPG